jgi:hypothetical protein
MLIQVQEIGKFGGLKDQNGTFHNPSKFAKGLPKFEVGREYDITTEARVSKKDGKTYVNIVAAKEVGAMGALGTAARKTVEEIAVKAYSEKKAYVKNVPTKAGVKAQAWGRDLSDYELAKDRRIGVAGVMQALIQSPIYLQQIELMQDAAAVDKFLVEKAEFFLGEIKRLSEGGK